MQYTELKEGIKARLNSAAEDFFTIGFYLRQIREGELFREDGYKSVWDFAKAEYGLSMASASRFIAINEKFGIEDGRTMEAKYIGMGVSKLQEMLTLPEKDLEKVTKETTVKQIREMKAAARRKDARSGGEERQCTRSNMGNPFSCNFNRTFAEHLTWQFKDDCQMLNHDLAEKRAGDGQPSPCCMDCEHYKSGNCYVPICDVARKKRDAERKAEEAEREKKEAEREKKEAEEKARLQKEAAEKRKAEKERRKAEEEAKRAIYPEEFEELYKVLGVREDTELAPGYFRDLVGKVYRSGITGPGFSYDCSPRGVRVNDSKEMTWAQVVKAFKPIQEKERAKAAEDPELDDDIIEADFKEVPEAPAEPAAEPEDLAGAKGPFERARAKVEAEKQAEKEAAENLPEEYPWKNYSASDVYGEFLTAKNDLAEFEKIQIESMKEGRGMPASLMREKQIYKDALELLYQSMTQRKEAEE